MPTRTISAAGGNWNATSSWTGGVVPIAGDDIVGNASSGNITVNVNTANLAFIDFRNYLGTIYLDALLNLGNTTTAGSTTFSATMSWATNFSYSDQRCINLTNTTGNQTIRTNGSVLPYLRSVKSSGAMTATLNDDLTCTNLSIGKGNAVATFNGTYSIRTQNFIANDIGGGNVGTMRMPNGKLIFIGPTASYTNQRTTDGVAFEYLNVDIDTGTFSTSGVMTLNGVNNNAVIKWINGTLVGDKQLQLFSTLRSNDFLNETQPIRLDLAGAGTWSRISYQPYCRFGPEADVRLLLDSDLFFDEMVQMGPFTINGFVNGSARKPLSVLGGRGALRGGRIIDTPLVAPNNASPTASLLTPTFSTPIIKLCSGPTHSFSDIHIFGTDVGLQLRASDARASGNAWFRSTTNSVPATVNFTGTAGNVAFYTYFQDINASSGNTIYFYGGGASGSTNVSSIDFGGGGGGRRSYTYIN